MREGSGMTPSCGENKGGGRNAYLGEGIVVGGGGG